MLSFEESSERYRKQLLHQGSIGCYVPEPSKASELIALWRQYVKVEMKVEIRLPVYKKVRVYALQWRPTKPHFYDVMTVLDHFERLPIEMLDRLTRKQRDLAEILVRRDARVERPVVVPVMPKNEYSVFAPELSTPTVHRLERIEYEFPPIASVEEVSVYAYPDWKRSKLPEYGTQEFLRQAERMIESKTKITDSRDVTIGNLPTLRMTSKRQ